MLAIACRQALAIYTRNSIASCQNAVEFSQLPRPHWVLIAGLLTVLNMITSGPRSSSVNN